MMMTMMIKIMMMTGEVMLVWVELQMVGLGQGGTYSSAV
jgi:hypothetical protein